MSLLFKVNGDLRDFYIYDFVREIRLLNGDDNTFLGEANAIESEMGIIFGDMFDDKVEKWMVGDVEIDFELVGLIGRVNVNVDVVWDETLPQCFLLSW